MQHRRAAKASLVMSISVLKALPGKLEVKRHSPSILYISASLVMSTSVLKALPGKLEIKRHLVFFISSQASRYQQAFSKPCLVNLISKDTHLVFSSSRCTRREQWSEAQSWFDYWELYESTDTSFFGLLARANKLECMLHSMSRSLAVGNYSVAEHLQKRIRVVST